MTTYSTRQDCANYVIEIIDNGQADANEYNIDQIVDRCFAYETVPGQMQKDGFVLVKDGDEFWAEVADAALPDFPAEFEPEAEDEIGDDGEPTGRTILTLSVGVDDDDEGWVEIDRLQYVTDDPESPEDLDELAVQLGEQGWKVVETPVGDTAAYRVARI